MKRTNKAKSIVAQPLFRSRCEKAGRGAGAYNRQDKRKSMQESHDAEIQPRW